MKYDLKMIINGVELLEIQEDVAVDDLILTSPAIANVKLFNGAAQEMMEIGATVSDCLKFTILNPFKESFEGDKVEFYISPYESDDLSLMEQIEEEVGEEASGDVICESEMDYEVEELIEEEEEDATEEELADCEVEENDIETSQFDLLEGIDAADPEEMTTNEEEEESWRQIGTYYVTAQNVSDMGVTLTCYDGFSKMNGEFVPENRKTTIQALFEDYRKQVFDECEIEVEAAFFDETYSIDWDFKCSYRRAAGYFAGILGGFAGFSEEGKLDISLYTYTGEILIDSELISMKETSSGEILIDGMECTVGIDSTTGETLEVGAGQSITFSNPFITSNILDEIFQEYRGTRIKGASITAKWNDSMIAGEFVRIFKEEEYRNYLKLNNQLAQITDEAEILNIKSGMNSLGKMILINYQTIEFSDEAISKITSICRGTQEAEADPETIFDLNVKRLDAKAQDAKQAADDAQAQADQAVKDAAQAQADANTAKSTADQAQTSADDAKKAADIAQDAVDTVGKSVEEMDAAIKTAQTTADTAKANAATAQTSADNAKKAADDAQTGADAAKEAADKAQTTADSAVTNAATAQTTADTAKVMAESASGKADAIKEDVETAEVEIAGLNSSLESLSNKLEAEYVRDTDLSTVKADLQTQISQNAAQIESTATKVTEVDETSKKAVADAKTLAATAQTAADAAKAQADQAVKDAAQAQADANTAKSAANQAQSAADAAQTAAEEADSKAQTAAADLAAAKKNLETVTSRVDATEEDIAAAQTAVEKAQAAADKANTDAEAAQTAADKAQTTANTAVANAETAQAAANDASLKAQEAQEKATSAGSAAENAQKIADTAKANAATAQTSADNAKKAADAAQTAAEEADSKAQTAAADLAAAKKNLETVTSRVDATEEDIAAAQTAVEKAQAAADTAKANAATAQTTADTAKANAATAQTSADNAKKAADDAQADADAAKQAADKAQEDVDSLGLRVTTAETKITQNSEAIKLAATKQEVTESLGGYYTKEEADAAIQVKADEIDSTVSKTYATQKSLAETDSKATSAGSAAENAQKTADTAKANAATAQTSADNAKKAADAAQADVDSLGLRVTTAETKITQNSEAIKLAATKQEVTESLGGYYTKEEADAAIQVKADEIDSIVSKTYATKATVESAESRITQTETDIKSQVSETTALGSRISSVEQTASKISVSLSKMETDIEEASKKATNFLEYTAENGLLLGNKSEDAWSGYRSQLLPDAFNILDADGKTLASYGAEIISIGKSSQNSTIEMCDGLAQIYYAQEDFDDEKVLKIKSESLELAGSTTSLHSWHNYPHNQYNVFVSTHANDADVGISLMVQHSTNATIWTNNYLDITKGGIESLVGSVNIESRLNTELTASGAILLHAFDGCVLMSGEEQGLYFSDDMDNWRTNKMNAMHMNESGHLRIGEGFYSNGKNTYIFGEDVYIRPSAANDAFRSYLKAGDEYEMYLPTAGYVYGSGKKVRFTIPLAKPVVGSPSVDVASIDGFILRQGGKFTHGSSDGVYVKPSSYSATLRGNGSFVDVIATFSANTNATSGDAIGILWNGKVSFGYG